jgi:hypothetical protein
MDVNGRSFFVGAVCILYIQASEASLEYGLRVMVEVVRGRQRGGLTRRRCVITYYVCHYSFVKTLLG